MPKLSAADDKRWSLIACLMFECKVKLLADWRRAIFSFVIWQHMNKAFFFCYKTIKMCDYPYMTVLVWKHPI